MVSFVRIDVVEKRLVVVAMLCQRIIGIEKSSFFGNVVIIVIYFHRTNNEIAETVEHFQIVSIVIDSGIFTREIGRNRNIRNFIVSIKRVETINYVYGNIHGYSGIVMLVYHVHVDKISG